MQKTDHYKEINFHAGHRVTGGRVYAYFVSTMERLQWNGKVFYDKDRFLKKLLRIALPFLPIAIIMTVYRIVRGNDSLISIIYSIVFQRWGPGGYYCFSSLRMTVF